MKFNPEGKKNHIERIGEVKTFSQKELQDYVYQGKSSLQDERFFSGYNGGVFKCFSLQSLNRFNTTPDELFYPTVWRGNLITGIAELQKSPYEENMYWIKSVSVDKKYEGQGYASKLLEEVFRFAQEKGFSLEGSTYTPEGKKLRTKNLELSEKYNVIFKDGKDF